MEFQFDKPMLLLLFLPAAFLIILFLKSKVGLERKEKLIIAVLRAIVFSLLIFSLAAPQLLIPAKGVNVVFVLDRSESVKDQEGQMLEEINSAIKKMKPDDKFAIVSVGERASVEQLLSSKEKGINELSQAAGGSYTNLSEGILTAASLLDKNSAGKLVLLSDGNENIGDVRDAAKVVKEQNVVVDVLPFEPAPKKDAALEELSIPASLYTGENAAVSIRVNSSFQSKGKLIIYQNDSKILEEAVSIKEGRNEYVFRQWIDQPGFHTFKAEIVAEGDQEAENNQAYSTASAKGSPSVLLVEGTEGNSENLFNALSSSGLKIKRIPVELLPANMAGYIGHQSIIFNNVPATKVTGPQMDMIESAVKDFGVGFIMAGGDQSYGLGGYFKTPIERLLPVDMELKGKKELPSLGLAIVLDRSGSMSGSKIELAKEAAARSVQLLREKDTLSFIAFDDRPWQIVKTGPIKNKKAVEKKIRSVASGGGTEIFSSLQMAYDQLSPLKLKRKHIILLTDGQSATNSDYSGLISQGLEDNVTLSTVAIGNDSDRMLLERLAEEGTGRYYEVLDPTTIPSILSRETALTTRTYIEDNPFYPLAGEGYDWSQTYFSAGVPELNAYVATTPKQRADIILSSPKKDPVLARWKYGLGQTIAWTSDTAGKWSGSWPAWQEWAPLWNEMVNWSFPNYQNDLYELRHTVDGQESTVEISSPGDDGRPISAKVISPDGRPVDSNLKLVAPGQYKLDFPSKQGIHFIQISKTGEEGISSTFQTGIAVPYSKEYEIKGKNTDALKETAKISKGHVLSSAEDVFNFKEQRRFEAESIALPLVCLAALLFFMEIVFRRFGLTPFLLIRKQTQQNKAKRTDAVQKMDQNLSRLKSASNRSMPKAEKREQERPLKETEPPKSMKAEKPAAEQTGPPPKKEETQQERMDRLLKARNRRK